MVRKKNEIEIDMHLQLLQAINSAITKITRNFVVGTFVARDYIL